MWPTLLLLFAIAAAALFWLANREAAERAREFARRLCADARVQLLDQTVVLRQMRLVRDGDALRWRRRYGFDYSADGVGRERGSLTLLGGEIEAASIPRAAAAGPPLT